jgi:hypothetical protein
MDLGEFVRMVIFGAFVIVVAYASVRAGSIAFYRTKYEHWRKINREGD